MTSFVKYTLLLLLTAVLHVGTACSNVPTGVQSPTPIPEYTQYVYRLDNDTGGFGSGFAVARIGEWTYIATARHVYRKALNWTVLWFQDDVRQSTTAEAFREHPDLDVALVRTKRTLRLLPMSNRLSFIINENLFAVGYLGDVYPAIQTVGSLKFLSGPYLLHSSAIWYGFSGGPLVDTEGFVVGVNVHMYRDADGPLSCRAGAVRIEYLKELLAQVKE